MTTNTSIEIAVPSGVSNTARGNVLEKLTKRFLSSQNCEVIDQVRLTGMEIDLLARDKDTGELILVECKAYRSNISANVISKLLGNIVIRNAQIGWLLSTSDLGKDAKGIKFDWEQRSPEQRRKLRIYEPTRLVSRLVESNVIVEPLTLRTNENARRSDESYLLLTEISEYWAIPILDRESGIPKSAAIFDARSGQAVTSTSVLLELASTDTSISELIEEEARSYSKGAAQTDLKSDLQSIVGVPVADHWADYRPARPVDFVGRELAQKEIFNFFEQVRENTSKTRLFAIKGPSGWGKSSLVLKISERSRNIRNRKKTFVYAVDARAASSKRFGELALAKTLKEAFKSKFIFEPKEFSFGSVANPFSTEGMASVLRQLEDEKKIVCLVFDQFEELLYKAELEAAFEQLNYLCNAIDEMQANIVIGFSWKTDGTIPTEHSAYHLWHRYSDRRKEIELTPFDAKEVGAALYQFARTLKQPLAPQLRRLLQDHCQGYPWLLKKLCIHVYELIQAGNDQVDILDRSLNIEDLFRKDLERLTGSEIACIRAISQEAPAENFRIVDAFGDDVVTELLAKRLIIRSGPRLNVYWDIFRDYVLTEKAPFIPVNYVPQTSLGTYLTAVHFLLQKRTASFEELAKELRISRSTVDNIARDLVMVGHAEVNRKLETLVALPNSEEAAATKLVDFCKTHVVYRALLTEPSISDGFKLEKIGKVVRQTMRPDLPEQQADNHRQKLARWFLSAGLIERKEGSYFLKHGATLKQLDDPKNKSYIRSGSRLFLADAPPKKAIIALDSIRQSSASRADFEALHGRNPIRVLSALNIIDSYCNLLLPPEKQSYSSEKILKEAVAKSEVISFVRDFLNLSAEVHGSEIGAAVAEKYDIEWKKESMQRTGAALRNWANWADGKQQVGKGRKLRRSRGTSLVSRKGIDFDAISPGSGLTAEQKIEVYERWKAGDTLEQIADHFGVNRSTIWTIKSKLDLG